MHRSTEFQRFGIISARHKSKNKAILRFHYPAESRLKDIKDQRLEIKLNLKSSKRISVQDVLRHKLWLWKQT